MSVVESAFPRAQEFLPERWYSQPELIQDRRAFAPFSQGTSDPYGLMGKNNSGDITNIMTYT